MTDRKSLWDSAGKAGLVLGLISIAYTLMSWLTGKMGADGVGMAFLVGALNVVLWLAKFVGCILVMRALMKRFVASEPGADNSDSFRFGVATSLLSALLFSAFILAFYSFIAPDAITDTMDTLLQNPSIASEGKEAIEAIVPKMPVIMFFSQLSYCFLFGLALSAILSRRIPSRNPFEDGADEQ